jgi:LacI family transcriptional regulator
MMTKRPSLQTIAEKCGLSIKTVSRILSGGENKHASETVEQVKALAAKLGYRRNLLVQSVRGGRTQTVGLIVPFLSDSYFTDFVRGVHDALIKVDCVPLLLLPNEFSVEREDIFRLIDRRVDGIILSSFHHEGLAAVLAEATMRNIPVVAANEPIAGSSAFDFVGNDDFHGGEVAARHLLELGHRRFAFIGLFNMPDQPALKEPTMSVRYQGFAHALAGAGCRCQYVPVILGDDVYRHACDLLMSKKRPTAVFMGLDPIVWDVYRAAADAGLSIPRDLSVVGFGDIDQVANRVKPPLTTMRQSGYALGRQTVHLLMERIAAGEKSAALPPRTIRIPAELVVRGSTALYKTSRCRQV